MPNPQSNEPKPKRQISAGPNDIQGELFPNLVKPSPVHSNDGGTRLISGEELRRLAEIDLQKISARKIQHIFNQVRTWPAGVSNGDINQTLVPLFCLKEEQIITLLGQSPETQTALFAPLVAAIKADTAESRAFEARFLLGLIPAHLREVVNAYCPVMREVTDRAVKASRYLLELIRTNPTARRIGRAPESPSGANGASLGAESAKYGTDLWIERIIGDLANYKMLRAGVVEAAKQNRPQLEMIRKGAVSNIQQALEAVFEACIQARFTLPYIKDCFKPVEKTLGFESGVVVRAIAHLIESIDGYENAKAIYDSLVKNGREDIFASSNMGERRGLYLRLLEGHQPEYFIQVIKAFPLMVPEKYFGMPEVQLVAQECLSRVECVITASKKTGRPDHYTGVRDDFIKAYNKHGGKLVARQTN